MVSSSIYFFPNHYPQLNVKHFRIVTWHIFWGWHQSESIWYWTTFVFDRKPILHDHSMARANLNRSKFFLTSTTTASKYLNTQETQNLHQLKSPLWDPNLLRKSTSKKIEVKKNLLSFRLAMAVLWWEIRKVLPCMKKQKVLYYSQQKLKF